MKPTGPTRDPVTPRAASRARIGAVVQFIPEMTLFAQVLVLVFVSLSAAIALNTLIIFLFPPPMPDFYRVSEVIQVMRGSASIPNNGRRPLIAQITASPPTPDPFGGPFMPLLQHDLASQLGATPDQIVIGGRDSPFSDRRIYRLVRERIAKGGMRAEERVMIAPFKVGLRLPDGRWRVVEPKPSFALTSWQQELLSWLVLSTLALAPLAYLFARRLTKPLAQFADAAERLGRDPGAPPLAIRGPVEIAVAVRAFNDMQERLARYVDDRTAMVGAIAHDLRTPLTRLRFRMEAAPEDVREKMVDDIAEMEAMISGTLAFVRDATRPANRTRLELSSLVESVADDMSGTGRNVTVESCDRVVIEGDPVALRRMLNNLLENAVKYGCLARARVVSQPGFAVVEIDDDGPGLPERELERVFEPFYRRDASRSRNTGGIGLGLAVVRSVSRAHGGDVTLENRSNGGLRARVRLPL